MRPVRCEINGADLARKRDREIIKFAYDFLAFRNICDEHSSAWVGRKQRKRYQISRVEAVLCLSVRKIVQPLYFRSAWWCFRERNENIWNDGAITARVHSALSFLITGGEKRKDSIIRFLSSGE